MNPKRHLRLTRPQSARAVARRSTSLEDFGRNLRDWFHELKRFSSRAQLRESVRTRPPRLASRFSQGEVADAYLAAQVDFLCRRSRLPPPRWTRDPRFQLEDPWFAVPGRELRSYLLLETPEEFRNRNLFTTPEFEFVVRRGRPCVSAQAKREKARLRQKRFRQRRASEGSRRS
jgi:hypothetical protein